MATETPTPTPNTKAVTLSAPGPRTKVPGVEEAQEIVARWERELADHADGEDGGSVAAVPTKIDLSGRAWVLDSLNVLRPFLEKHVGTIEVLKIDDILVARPTEEGLATYSFFNEVFGKSESARVTHLYLQDNAMGTRGHEALKDLLQAPTLRVVNLYNCGIAEEVAKSLCEEVLPLVAPHLVALHLGRNQIGPVGARHFGEILFPKCESLQVLSYDGCRPNREGTQYICSGIAKMTAARPGTLRELNLPDCLFGDGSEPDDGVGDLAAALRCSPNLVKLNLNDGSLGVDGLTSVIDALSSASPPLEVLDVGAMELGLEGAETLSSFIRTKLASTLQELNVETNELEDDGLEKLLEALTECEQLQVLNVSENLLGEKGWSLLVSNRLPNLKVLRCKENEEEDVDPDVVAQLRAMYPRVVVDEEDEHKDKQPAAAVGDGGGAGGDADALVDELAQAMGGAQI